MSASIDHERRSSTDIWTLRVRARFGDYTLSAATSVLLLNAIGRSPSTLEWLGFALLLDVLMALIMTRSISEQMMGLTTNYRKRHGRKLSVLVFDTLILLAAAVGTVLKSVPLIGVMLTVAVIGGISLWTRKTKSVPWERIVRLDTRTSFQINENSKQYLLVLFVYVIACFSVALILKVT